MPGLRVLLARAGLAEVSPAGLVMVSFGSGLTGFVAVQVLSRTAPVALAFGVIGAYLPFAVLRGRARRRQREFAEVWPEAVDNLASGIRAGLALPEALAVRRDIVNSLCGISAATRPRLNTRARWQMRSTSSKSEEMSSTAITLFRESWRRRWC